MSVTEVGCVLGYRVEDVAVIVLDRPAKYNALGASMLSDLKEAVDGCGADARSIVLASEGPHFCVGADLAEVASLCADRSGIRSFLELFHEVANSIAASTVPVIAAVQGFALAGGLELALACDLIVAANDAEFGDQHINVDLVPGGGGSQRLPRAIGSRRALALQLLGDRVDARRALAWGLVHSVHSRETLRDEAVLIASRIASRDPMAVRRIRQLGRVASAVALEDGLAIELAVAAEHLSAIDISGPVRNYAEQRRTPVERRDGDRRQVR
ncbi:MAG: enoyl-CoA hydratase/isomerase family protein [Acidimicrobiaceae bacterium]|nr:enoyl-CoA hydratase/isomerase family protein [Acidimicrobiaceae bacterium]